MTTGMEEACRDGAEEEETDDGGDEEEMQTETRGNVCVVMQVGPFLNYINKITFI